MYSSRGMSWNLMRWWHSDMNEPKAKNNQYIMEDREESVSISSISSVKTYYQSILIQYGIDRGIDKNNNEI